MPDLWMDVDADLSEVPVNIAPLIDDGDFKTREVGIVFNQAGMDLVWNFVTTAGAISQTAVTPTAAGDYDWTNQGDGMYSIEIPAAGGADINNDTEGFGWFTGYCTGVLPWRGPIIGFRAAGLNNALIDSAHSATRGLAGTALPDAAADAAGGLPISDLGGLDMDAILSYAVSAAAWGSINSGTIFRGVVTADNPGVSFTIAGLAGQGAGAFVDANTPWYAYVFRDAGGAAGAPQGEVEKVTGYTTGTGLFTTDAFTVPVATGDDVMIVSAALINSLAIKTRVELALPNAAADAAGGLPVSDAGGLDLDTLLGELAAANLPTDIAALNAQNVLILADTGAIVIDVAGLGGAAMRGTDNAALAATALSTAQWTAARAAALDELLAANLPTDVAALNAQNVLILADTAALLLRVVGTILAGNHTAQTGDSFARLGAPAGASVSADIAAIQGSLPAKIVQNQALANFKFVMVSNVDHVTGVVLAAVVATRSIDGGAFGACANAVVEIGFGVYRIDLAAADLNGTTIMLRFTAAGCDDRFIEIVTQV